jgi:hypothetical protein
LLSKLFKKDQKQQKEDALKRFQKNAAAAEASLDL